MSFIWPAMLILLLLIPLFAALYIRMQRRRQRLAASYASFGLAQQSGRRLGSRRHLPAVLFLVGLTILIIALARRGRHKSQAQLSLAEYFRAERERVQAQISLLRSVPLWYLGPILLGANLFVAGFKGFFPEAFGFLVVSLLLSVLIYWLNLRAVRRHLLPMRRELDSLIGELEPNGDQSLNVQ